MDIVEFLTARLDEREAVAHYSGPARVAWLTYRDSGGEMRYTTVAALAGDGETWVADGHDLAEPASVLDVYDPAHVLAEVAAKRAILAEHKHVPATEPSTDDFGCQICAYDRGDCVQYAWGWCKTVRLLALPYGEHPDYDPAWVVA